MGLLSLVPCIKLTGRLLSAGNSCPGKGNGLRNDVAVMNNTQNSIIWSAQINVIANQRQLRRTRKPETVSVFIHVCINIC